MHQFPKDIGWIEVICGSMFSGKTEELIRRVQRAVYGKQKVQVFKPRIDNRYDESAVVSHSQHKVLSTAIERAEEIFYRLAPDTQVVGIDEVQFFGSEVVAVVEALANKGLRVICAGLDQDYQGRPFEPMPQLMAVSEYVTKELAICVVCGNPANRSQRIVSSGERVVVGAAGAYEPRCRKCHVAEPAEGTPPQTLELFD
ncbi:thymidine kinase [Myxococcus xanthus DK 1622]|uniref:Thymidine kinase n=4 Tax=Myxococcus TaxID=32 RepID=Q1D297_MYXXD|nr:MULTISPECIES: thymidine kinase [Myxococcus]ABF92262.1 thymidine kinase [Myxococcus xanthus DK 1622]NOJ54428.1 thymidine kinase [Myxococcus xanthus]NOJ80157.1 thymidine kinase [Myxococcus xanthus]NOJ90934.1 thymidine kinase [Myxococcus xanthus]QDE91777.1 thymidine kinase [Myxococcus xanthus]